MKQSRKTDVQQVIAAATDKEYDETPSFRSVEDLQSLGINVSDIKKLIDAGLNTIGSVLQASMRELITIKGLSEAKVEKIRESARKVRRGKRTTACE